MTMDAIALPWRWRQEGGPSLVSVGAVACEGSAAVETALPAEAAGATLSFALEAASFLHAARISAAGPAPVAVEVEYLSQGGGGESSAAQVAWFSIATFTLSRESGPREIIWPDAGAHREWRLRVLEGAPGCTLTVHALLQWHWEVRLDSPAAFSPASNDLAAARGLSQEAMACLQQGDLVFGDNNLLSQLYHESDLLTWGAPIPFPCFMTIWAKPESPHDFAGLVHRFRQVRPPLLVLSGTGVQQRTHLREMLKHLLRPEFQPLVKDAKTADEVIEALWRSKATASGEAPPTLALINARLQAIQDRLGLPPELRCEEYTVQFRRRDPLMLLMTKEAFGGWAPNRVFAEIEGHDIFRTYAEFSCVDGVVCAEDAVWLHSPKDFYEPAALPEVGDKRSVACLELLEKQRPYIVKLLGYYVEKGMISEDFRAGLEAGFLAASHLTRKGAFEG